MITTFKHFVTPIGQYRLQWSPGRGIWNDASLTVKVVDSALWAVEGLKYAAAYANGDANKLLLRFMSNTGQVVLILRGEETRRSWWGDTVPVFTFPRFALRAEARVLWSELSDWWSALTPEQQDTYINEHPKSQKAKDAKAREKKSGEDDKSKDQSTDKDEDKSDDKSEDKLDALTKSKGEARQPDTKEGLGKQDGLKGKSPIGKIGEKDRKDVLAILTRLKDMADQAKAAGEKAPNFDLCEVSVPGTNLFCGVNKGIPRERMPQLKGMALPGTPADSLPKAANGEVDSEKAFIASLKEKGVKMTPKKVDASRLKSTQSQLVGAKVAGMTAALQKDPSNAAIRAPIFVSKDGYILDGHHRWAAVVGLSLHNDAPVEMDTIVVDLSAEELVDYTNDFCNEFGIEQKGA
jgi:hypothetical protein